jgi:hypothetical protein
MTAKQEIEAKISRFEAALAKTTDVSERQTMQGVIDKLKKQASTMEEKPESKTKPGKTFIPKSRGKSKQKPTAKKVEVKPKPEKKADKKGKKEIEKTVKISKVLPVEEKKNVEDILESEHYKVIFKEVGGKKIKITVKNSDRVVAKNKIDSAFTTIAKKVIDSEEERKKYAEDIKTLDTMKSLIAGIVENIYKAFNSHKTTEMKALLRKLKTL